MKIFRLKIFYADHVFLYKKDPPEPEKIPNIERAVKVMCMNVCGDEHDYLQEISKLFAVGLRFHEGKRKIEIPPHMILKIETETTEKKE